MFSELKDLIMREEAGLSSRLSHLLDPAELSQAEGHQLVSLCLRLGRVRAAKVLCHHGFSPVTFQGGGRGMTFVLEEGRAYVFHEMLRYCEKVISPVFVRQLLMCSEFGQPDRVVYEALKAYIKHTGGRGLSKTEYTYLSEMKSSHGTGRIWALIHDGVKQD